MQYEGIVYRPPSEARSLIIQVTIGCAHNTCTFCNMYKAKKFRIRSLEEIFSDLAEFQEYYGSNIRRVFLADGDALVMKTADLLTILAEIKRLFPYVERITSYGTAQDILHKSEEELKQLKTAGLTMIYMGAETGSNEILRRIQKGVTTEQLIEAGKKIKQCGLQSSITLISGLGGRELVEEHALACAHLITETHPDYASFLTLGIYKDTKLYESVQNGEFEEITPEEILEEMLLFLEHVDSSGTIFRTNHASNYVILAGTLNKDIPQMKQQLKEVERTHHYRRKSGRAIL